MGNILPFATDKVSGPANSTVTTIHTQTPTGPVTTTISTQSSSSSSILMIVIVGLVLLAVGYALIHFKILKLPMGDQYPQDGIKNQST